MAILSRPNLQAQERFDLEDWLLFISGMTADSKDQIQQFWSSKSYVFKGFSVGGVGTTGSVTVNLANATLINSSNTGEFSWFTSQTGASPIVVPVNSNNVNYLELVLSNVNGTPLPKAFWDPSANSGAGAEFQQTVNTITNIEVSVNVLVSGFSGSANSIPLAIVGTDGTNTIREIIDQRPLFFRLGSPVGQGGATAGFTWSSQIEPSITLALSSVSGTFVTGETVTFGVGGTSALVTSGGTSSITINNPSSLGLGWGGTLFGLTSGAQAHVDFLTDSFTGADKDLGDLRSTLSAMMNEIRALKGTKYWFNPQTGSINGAMNNIHSPIVPSPTANNPVVKWDGSNLSLTDSNLTPSSANVMSIIRQFGVSTQFNMLRQDGTAGTAVIPMASGQVLFVTLPTSGDVNFSGVGSGATNFQVINRSSYVINDQNFWLAYREGSKIIFRGTGELQPGEATPIGDTIPQSLLNSIGLPTEVSIPAYSSDIRGVSGESIISRVGVLTNLIGDEQEDRSMFFKCDSPIVWTGTQLIFTSPITLECPNAKFGTPYTATISTAFSPINISNGNVIYFQLNRGGGTLTPVNSSVTPIPAQSQAQRDIFVLCKREDVSSGTYGVEDDVFTENLLYIPLHRQVLRKGQTCYLGETNVAGQGAIRIDYFDPISTSLPSGSSVTIDNVAGVNGDLVLYGNLGSGNNLIYELGGVGSSITWTPQYSFTTGQTPLVGEQVMVTGGNSFANRPGEFDGTKWNFNRTVRYFNGADYVEFDSITSSTLLNNTTAPLISVNVAGSENWVIHYSLFRGTTKETGTLWLTSDDISADITRASTMLNGIQTGSNFSASITSGVLNINYTLDNSGSNATMKYFYYRWSNSGGGPNGVPNYAGSSGSTIAAAGNINDVQYKGSGGNLAADDRFQWDSTNGALNLNGYEIFALNGPVTILNNQVSPTTLFTFNGTTFPYAIIEYSITRNGDTRVGRFMVTNNGTVAGYSDDYAESNVGGAGVNLSATYSAGTVSVQYTSDNAGPTGIFKYSMRAWA